MSSHFDHQPEIVVEVQDKIDWDLFKGQGPTPLRTFSADPRTMHSARLQPSPTQQSTLSSAHQLVQNVWRSIIKLVLATFDLLSDLLSDGEQLAPVPTHDKEKLCCIRLHHKICSEPDKCMLPMLPLAVKKKPKSETYKQAWSVSEQHLLDRLLSEIATAKRIGTKASTKDCAYSTKYRRLWVVTILRIRSQVVPKVF
ncbi:hypothetical protein V8E53_003052 [Lactarius tabidus]